MQREEKGKGKGGKGAGIDRCRAITNLSISRVVIGVDGAQSSRTEPGACTLGKIISRSSLQHSTAARLRRHRGSRSRDISPNLVAVECLDHYASTECGHTFPETAAGLPGDKMLPGISEVPLEASNIVSNCKRWTRTSRVASTSTFEIAI